MLNFKGSFQFGAVDGTRTRDPQLGKLVLYQLSYYRVRRFDDAKLYIKIDSDKLFLKLRGFYWPFNKKSLTLHRFLAIPCDGKLRSVLILSNTLF